MEVTTVVIPKEDVEKEGYRQEFSDNAGLAFIAELPLSNIGRGRKMEYVVYVFGGENSEEKADKVIKTYRQKVPTVSHMKYSGLFENPFLPIVTSKGFHYPKNKVGEVLIGNVFSEDIFDEEKYIIFEWKNKRYITGAEYDKIKLYTG